MKTTATAVVWRRVLLACLLCALWSEGTAAELSLGSGVHGDLLKWSQRLKDSAERTSNMQISVANLAFFPVEVLEPIVPTAEKTLKSGGQTDMKDVLAAVKGALQTAKRLRDVSQKTNVAVNNADGKSGDVADGVLRWKEKAVSYEEMRQKVDEWKRAAGEAAELWREAAESADSQLSEIDETLKDAQKAKEAVEKAMAKVSKAPDADSQEDVKTTLTTLTTSFENILEGTKTLKASAQAAKEEITGTSEVIAQTTKKADDFLKAVKEDAQKNANDLKTQGLHGGSDNSTNGDGSNKDSSPDGSPLTVFCLAATSVLLLARVAAVMITV